MRRKQLVNQRGCELFPPQRDHVLLECHRFHSVLDGCGMELHFLPTVRLIIASIPCIWFPAFAAAETLVFAGVPLGVQVETIPECVPVPKTTNRMVCTQANQSSCESFNKRMAEVDAKYPDYFPPEGSPVCRKTGWRSTYSTDPKTGPPEEGFALHELRVPRVSDASALRIGSPTFVLTKNGTIYKIVYDYRGVILPIDDPRQIRAVESAQIDVVTDFVGSAPVQKELRNGCSGDGSETVCWDHVRVKWIKGTSTVEMRRDDVPSGRLTITLSGFEKPETLELPSFTG